MSDFLNKAVAELGAKLGGGGFDGSAKIAVADVGSIMLDSDGARLGGSRCIRWGPVRLAR